MSVMHSNISKLFWRNGGFLLLAFSGIWILVYVSQVRQGPHSCSWADEIPFNDHGIRPRSRPAFPLTQAWLKPEAARYGPAPENIPAVLRAEFSMDYTIEIEKFYLNQSYLGGEALVSNWSMALISRHRESVRARQSMFTYDAAPVYGALDAFGNVTVNSKRGLVIGSEDPWLESFLLEYGAGSVATVEFGHIMSEHPLVSTFTPKEFTMGFLHGDIEPFDFSFIYSSIEHDGLGRYGDVLNPSGDLETMAKMLSVVKPGGFAFVGLPCCLDALHWNAHRIYGRKRLTELFSGWKIIAVFPEDSMKRNHTLFQHGFQPVWVLQNTFGCYGGEAVDSVWGIFRSFRML